MRYAIYQSLHVFAALGLVAALAAVGALRPSTEPGLRRLAMMLHGAGLVLLLISGFGMLAVLGLSSAPPGWVWAKIALWLLLAVAVALPRWAPGRRAWLIWLAPVGAGLAGLLAILRPF